MPQWVMTSQVKRAPWLLTFCIGQVKVAEISFQSPTVVRLDMWGARAEFFAEPKAVSQAMTAMHERLKTPPEGKRPPICDGCGVNRADPPGSLCPGCQAYHEHQQ